MKKISLLFSISFLSLTSFGQLMSRGFTPRPVNAQAISSNLIDDNNLMLRGGGGDQVMMLDTIWTYFDRRTGLVTYLDPGYGYVFGTDQWNTDTLITNATGVHYDGIGTANVTKIIVFLKSKKIMGGVSDTITFSINSVKIDSSPLAVLGSIKVPVSALDTAIGVNIIPIPASVTDEFLIVADYSNLDDSIGFISNVHGDGQGEKRSRMLINPKLIGFPDIWIWSGDAQFFFPGLNVDVMFIPILDDVTGLGEFKNELFSLKSISPVPSTGVVSLEYTLAESASVSYSIMDIRGKVVIKSNSEMKTPSTYKETIDMTGFAAGQYFVTFNAGTKTLTQQMMISK